MRQASRYSSVWPISLPQRRFSSGKRIAEVLEEKADITAPPKTLDCVRDGSIDFDHMTFSYRQGSMNIITGRFSAWSFSALTKSS